MRNTNRFKGISNGYKLKNFTLYVDIYWNLTIYWVLKDGIYRKI